jgi:hypothetical protein
MILSWGVEESQVRSLLVLGKRPVLYVAKLKLKARILKDN